MLQSYNFFLLRRKESNTYQAFCDEFKFEKLTYLCALIYTECVSRKKFSEFGKS